MNVTKPGTNLPAKAPDTTPPAIKQVHHLFAQHRRAIEDALPKHLTADRMIRIALTELRKGPSLQQCDPLSFLGAIVQASQLGLEPGSALGQCYLIPYGRECQLQIGYRGMVDLSRRSGNIVSISARCIYAGDVWGVEFGTEEKLKHTPSFTSTDITHVYAVARLKDGGTQFEIMSKAEVEYIRDTYSAGYKRNPKSSPWTTSFDEMAKKTVVRRLFKMLPTSIEIMDAIRVDEDDSQQNARLIDPNHDVVPFQVDPEKITRIQSEGGNDRHQTEPAAAAERRQAIEAFSKTVETVRKAGGDPAKIINGSPNDVLLGPTDAIFVATDLLELWVEDHPAAVKA